MDSQKLNPIDRIAELVANGQNFVLQGGAGSGKTESLKRVVQRILESNPDLRIACITHTNKAADEIADRVSAPIKVSTIHSFLGEIISPFKRNIKHVFPKLFELPEFVALDDEHYGGDEKTRKKEEHERFKKLHKKLESRRRMILGEATDKVPGKPKYDKDPPTFNAELNEFITELNAQILELSLNHSPSAFSYNDTAYDNFNEPSYGHDGLISTGCHIFDEFPLLGKIVSDRYDCIFIDEYQDTDAGVIRVLLSRLPEKDRTVIGLFGDSEQAIYSDGIGSAQAHIDSGELILVEKEDNYRCSPQVIEFANQFRTDGIKQEVALKTLDDGKTENAESREGSVKLLYDLAPEPIDTGNKTQDRKANTANFRKALDSLVERVSAEFPGFVQLKLTNKAIANDVGFGGLYQVFDDRYTEPRDRMRKTLDRLQFGELVELINLHKSLPGDRRSYNRLIATLKKRGFSIKSVADKARLDEILRSFSVEDRGAYEAIEFATESGLIKLSDSRKAFLTRRDELLARLAKDEIFSGFEKLHQDGFRTKNQMQKEIEANPVDGVTRELVELQYDDRDFEIKQKKFYEGLFSTDLPMKEVIAFYEYEDTDSEFSTMHKTKGTGIENVLLVIDEYGWTSEYDFLSCFFMNTPESRKEISSRKLLYVAASRTKKNLICVRLMNDQAEADHIAPFFPDTIRVQ